MDEHITEQRALLLELLRKERTLYQKALAHPKTEFRHLKEIQNKIRLISANCRKFSATGTQMSIYVEAKGINP